MSAVVPRVSVVIPVYRGEQFVVQAIESVLAHAGDDVEIVVVDDASPDHAAERVQALGDSRVKLVRHGENRGIAAARNSGVCAARGEFVAFLDQDDLWTSGRLGAQLEAAGHGASVVLGDMVVRRADGREFLRRPGLPVPAEELDTRALLTHLIVGEGVSLGSALIRRSALDAAGRFDESVRGGADDYDMLIRLAEVTRFHYRPGATLVWRLHEANYTSARRMMEEAIAIIDRTARCHGLAEAARAGRARCYYRRAAEAYMDGDRVAAQADFRRALGEQPRHKRACLGWLACRLGINVGLAMRVWAKLQGM